MNDLPCNRCGNQPRTYVEKLKAQVRYCKDCLKELKKEMADSGYLVPAIWPKGKFRSQEMMEHTHETKFGRPE